MLKQYQDLRENRIRLSPTETYPRFLTVGYDLTSTTDEASLWNVLESNRELTTGNSLYLDGKDNLEILYRYLSYKSRVWSGWERLSIGKIKKRVCSRYLI